MQFRMGTLKHQQTTKSICRGDQDETYSKLFATQTLTQTQKISFLAPDGNRTRDFLISSETLQPLTNAWIANSLLLNYQAVS